MDLISLTLIGIGLAMDCFAVSLGIGAGSTPRDKRTVFRLSFHFGLFQGGMTLLGWLVGTTIAQFVASLDHWVALALLGWIGVRMIIEGLKKESEEDEKPRLDPSRGGTLVMLAVATSLDAMAVGLSLALIQVNIWGASLLIGLISLGLSLVGLRLGNRLGTAFGKRMEVIGGLILIGIGLRILLSHLFA